MSFQPSNKPGERKDKSGDALPALLRENATEEEVRPDASAVGGIDGEQSFEPMTEEEVRPGAFAVGGIDGEQQSSTPSLSLDEPPEPVERHSTVIRALQRQAQEYQSQLRRMQQRERETPTLVAELVTSDGDAAHRTSPQGNQQQPPPIVEAKVVRVGHNPKRRNSLWGALIIVMLGGILAVVLSLTIRDNDPDPFTNSPATTDPPTLNPAAPPAPPPTTTPTDPPTPIPTNFSWVQRGQTISGLSPSDYFGSSVALSSDGNVLAAGASRSDPHGQDSGQVRVFRYTDSSWTRIGQNLNGRVEGGGLGTSVALSSDGQTLAVGASFLGAGYVQVFSFNEESNRWDQKGPIIHGKRTADSFGQSVALSSDGTIVAAGADRNDENGVMSGHVRVFKYTDVSRQWEQMGKDMMGDAERAHFGTSVALSSNGKFVAGSAALNDGEARNASQVRVWTYSDTNQEWYPLGQALRSEEASDDSHWSVALSSDGAMLATAGSVDDGDVSHRARVRVYQLDNELNQWRRLGQDLNSNGRFRGWLIPVALSSDGKTLATGHSVTGNEEEPNPSYSWVFAYDDEANMWKPHGLDLVDSFGESSVAISSRGMVVAAGDEDEQKFTGHVKVFGPN